MMRHALVLALALSLGACASWPEPQGGGMAEVAPPAPLPAARQTVADRHLVCTLQHLAALSQAAETNGHGIGRLALLETDAARAQREVAGRLTDDAERTLERLDRDAAAFEAAYHLATSDPRSCSA